jgi:hypothetical protein
VLAGAGLYEARQASTLRDQVQTLQQQQAPLAEEIHQLQSERDSATNRLADLIAENGSLKSNQPELLKLRGEVTRLRVQEDNKAAAILTSNMMRSEVEFWLSRVAKLKERVKQSSEQDIPEFQFMTDRAWMMSSQLLIDSDSDKNFTNAIRFAQGCAKNEFGKALEKALQIYSTAIGGGFPTDFKQLQPYIEKLMDDRVFQRYEIVPAKLELVINQDTKTAQQVYRTVDVVSVGSQPATMQWVIFERQPLYNGDARLVVSSTGVHIQPFE